MKLSNNRYKHKIAFLIIVCILLMFNRLHAADEKRLVDNGNGTITDTITGLMWTKEIKNTNKEPEAIEYNKIKFCNAGGYTDWRLPTVDELRSITLPYNEFYNVFSYGEDYISQWPLQMSYWTNEEIVPDYLSKEYLSFSDGITIENKLSNHRGYAKLLCHVRGAMKDNLIVRLDAKLPIGQRKEIDKYIKANNCAFFKQCRSRYSNNEVYLIPSNLQDFPLLTYCPLTAFSLIKMTDLEIKKLSIENQIINNEVPLINLWEVRGFEEYYEKLQKLDKFDLAENKTAIKQKIIICKQEYQHEYNKYLKTTFLLTPVANPIFLTKDNYNIDTNRLAVTTTDGIVSRGDIGFGNCEFYGAKFHKGLLTEPFLNIPLYNPFSVNLGTKEVSNIFKRFNKITYVPYIYVQPIPGDSYAVSTTLNHFKVKGIVLRFFGDTEKEFMAIVLHDFQLKIEATKNGFFNRFYIWKTEILRF